MGALISSLANFAVGASVLRWIAFKTVAYALMVVVLPIILWNVMAEWTETLLNYALTALPTDSAIYDMTGFAGWLAIQLSIPQAITVLVSGLATRFLLSALLRI